MTNSSLIEKLERENKYLKSQVRILTNDNYLKDEIVIQQSKMASMGEMLDNITHQWRQPLMEIATIMMKLESTQKIVGEVSSDDIYDTITKSNNVIQFMSNTIEDFRNFFTSNKQKEHFSIAEQISFIMPMINSSVEQNNIKLDIVIKKNSKIYGFKNEYSQVLLNILSNAIDIIKQRDIINGKVTIKVYEKDNYSIIEVEDNAGGIECEPLDKVFEPFFTYNKTNGTGIGLFMSKLIIENNMNGILNVVNRPKGACFKIQLPLV